MSSPANSNVGSLLRQLREEGLVPTSDKIVIDSNEWGVKSLPRRYYLRNVDYPALEPAAGAAPPDPPDMDLRFLGKATARFNRNGHVPGIGILEVLYKGAVFPDDDPAGTPNPDSVTPYFPSHTGQRETVNLGYFVNDAIMGEPPAWAHDANLSIEYFALHVHYQYVARTKPEVPRYIAGNRQLGFTADAATDTLTIAASGVAPDDGTRIRVSVAGAGALPAGLLSSLSYYVRDSSGSTCKLALTAGGSAIDLGISSGTLTMTIVYQIDDDHPVPVINGITARGARGATILAIIPPPEGYEDFLEYRTEIGEFTRVPCGRYWEVTETGIVKIFGWVPSPLVLYLSA